MVAAGLALCPSCVWWLRTLGEAGGFYGPARGGEFRRTAPSGLGKCTNTPLGDRVVLHAEASPRPTIVLDDDLRSVVSVSVQRTKVSSFDSTPDVRLSRALGPTTLVAL